MLASVMPNPTTKYAESPKHDNRISRTCRKGCKDDLSNNQYA